MLTNPIIRLYIEIVSFCFYLLIILVNKSLRLRIVGAEHYYSLKEQGSKIIFIFWHQASFIPIYHYRGQGACILTMKHLRGEIMARAAERFGYQVIRLEKEEDPAGVLQFMKLVKRGYDCNLAVDGPTGPIFKLKPGAIFLAKKLKNPILPVATAASPRWILKCRWDKYFVPWPFAKAVMMLGEPIFPAGSKVEELMAKGEKALKDLTTQAEDSIT